MNKTFSTQSFKNLLDYPFKDEQAAAKLFIFGLLSLLGLVIPLVLHLFVLGYLYRIMQTVIRNDGELTLPEWDRWGALFVDGLKMFFNLILYLGAPAALLMAGFWIMLQPYIGIITALINTRGANPGITSDEIASQFIGLILSGLGLVWAGGFLLILLIFFVPPVLGHLVATGRLFAGFQCGKWGKVLAANFSGFMGVFIFSMGLYVMAMSVSKALSLTLVLSFLAPLPILFMVFLPLYILPAFAQAYREGAEKPGFQNVPAELATKAEMPPSACPEQTAEITPEPVAEALTIPEPEPQQPVVVEPATPKRRRKNVE
jgi:hypothetical protein